MTTITDQPVIGYFSGDNPNDIASFLGRGLRRDDEQHSNYMVTSVPNLSAVPTSTGPEGPGNLRTGTSVKCSDGVLARVRLSPELEAKLRTGPTVIVGGSTVHYIPLGQSATEDPPSFNAPKYPPSLNIQGVASYGDSVPSSVSGPGDLRYHQFKMYGQQSIPLTRYQQPSPYFMSPNSYQHIGMQQVRLAQDNALFPSANENQMANFENLKHSWTVSNTPFFKVIKL